MEALHEQSFGSVHVADPCDDRLIHEEVTDSTIALTNPVDHLLRVCAAS
jgi:hypothetical protein